MDEPLLRQRVALWRARADQASEPHDREACLEIATRYEQMARLLEGPEPHGLPPPTID